MNRKLKALGLALIAVLAMGALSASAASAAEFHSENGTDTVIKGSQVGTDVFTVNAGTVKCTEATYAGVQSGATASSVTVAPTYSGCTAFGFVSTTIDTAGCTYKFAGNASEGLEIGCEAGKTITVTAFNCHVKVSGQKLTGVTYTNTGSGSSRDVDVKVSISGIKYTQESKSFPGCTNGSFSNGTYAGEATVQGFTTGGTQVGVWNE